MDIKTIIATLESIRREAEEVFTEAELASVRDQETLWESFLDQKIEEELEAL